MSVFLKIAGAALIVLGLGLGLTIFTKPGMLDAYGIRLDTAALLLIGGILAMGQSALIDALKMRRLESTGTYTAPAVAASATPMASAQETPTPTAAPQAATMASNMPAAFGRKPDLPSTMPSMPAARLGMATAAGAGLAAVAATAASKDPVADTISALEKAKADVIKSIGGMDDAAKAPAPAAMMTPSAEPAAAMQMSPAAMPAKAMPASAPEAAEMEEETTEEATMDEDGLYVVEERVVRGRPARILSDDTVEAETDEGWMRFENMEHLNEYLDSVEEQSA